MNQIETALFNFIAKTQAIINNHYATYHDVLTPPMLEVEKGIRYYKVWNYEKHRNTGESYHKGGIFAFIDKNTGDIFMPATYKKPAEHARGNVLSDDNGIEALNSSGTRIRYKADESFIG